MVASWLLPGLGGLLVAVVLRDLFHTIFHPGGQGVLSRLVLRTTWRCARAVGGRERLGELAGPLGVVAVIGTWAASVVLGGALVYWASLPEGFSYATGLDPGSRAGFLDALYVSLVAMTTLGLGDIVPTAGWLRVVTPLQAMLGFALLSAAVSWVLQIYPALNRRRTLAARLWSLHRSGLHEALDEVDSAMPAVLLADLAGQLAQMRVDLMQYAETYYFRAGEKSTSLPAALPYAAQLAAAGRRSSRRDVRLAAADLACSLQDLTDLLRRRYLTVTGAETPDRVLDAYAADHGETELLGRSGSDTDSGRA